MLETVIMLTEVTIGVDELAQSSAAISIRPTSLKYSFLYSLRAWEEIQVLHYKVTVRLIR